MPDNSLSESLLDSLREAAADGAARFNADRFESIARRLAEEAGQVGREIADRLVAAGAKIGEILAMRAAGTLDDVAATRALGRQKARITTLTKAAEEAGAHRLKRAREEFFGVVGDALQWVAMLARGILQP